MKRKIKINFSILALVVYFLPVMFTMPGWYEGFMTVVLGTHILFLLFGVLFTITIRYSIYSAFRDELIGTFTVFSWYNICIPLATFTVLLMGGWGIPGIVYIVLSAIQLDLLLNYQG